MLFFSKLKFKTLREPAKLVGPNIAGSKQFTFNLDQTQVSLRLPRHSTVRNVESVDPKKHYRLDSKHFSRVDPNKSGWEGLLLASRASDFFGPKFTGKQSTLQVGLSLVSPIGVSNLVSLFHPRSFEFIIGELMWHNYGEEVHDGRAFWVAPKNWKRISSHGSICARFDVVPLGEANREVTYFLLPVSENVFLQIQLFSSWNILSDENDNAYPNQRDWLDRSSMRQLIDDIIDSVKVDFSENVQYQQKEALKGLDDTSLCEHYPPIDFSRAKVSHPQSSASLASQIDE